MMAKNHRTALRARLSTEHKALLGFTRLLASYGCAGEPACEPSEGTLCGVCEAREWLSERGYVDEPPQGTP